MQKYNITTEQEMVEFLKDFNFESFSFDVETTDLRQDRLELEGVSLCDGRKACYFAFEPWTLPFLPIIFLTSPNGLKIAHNAVFDMRVLYKYGIHFPKAKLYDTMVASHLIDENSPNGLKHLAKAVLGKEDIMDYKTAKAIGGDTFVEYATNDAIWTWELCQKQQSYMREPMLAKLFRNIEMPFQFVLLEMAITGVTCDLEKRAQIEQQVKEDIEISLQTLCSILNLKPKVQCDLFGNMTITPPINFNSPQQVAKIVFEDLGLKIIETTPTGKPAVGAKTLIAYQDNEFVAAYHKYKKQQKILGGFIEPMLGFVEDDGKIRPNFRDIGTTTGRLSCNNPNLQQLPKASIDPYGVRACFGVPDGYKMITCDYSGQEVRVMAQQSKDPVLVDALNKGQDMHLKVANQFYKLGIPEEHLFETGSEYEFYKKKYKNERTQAKVITFGLAYGKAQPYYSKILTPVGWKLMKDMKVGTELFTACGEVTKVTGVYPQPKQDIYEITMTDGSKTRASGQHLWEVSTRYDISLNKKRIMKTTDMLLMLKKGRQNNIFIDYIKPIQYTKKKQNISAYLMGVYIGDGDSGNRLTIAKQRVLDKVKEQLPIGYSLNKGDEIHYLVTEGKHKNVKGQYISNNVMINESRRVGLYGKTCYNKFIPRDYLQGDVIQRWNLFYGLMDSDGSKNNNCWNYTTTSKQLSLDVKELVKSLGARATITSRIPTTNFGSAQRAYRVFISFEPVRQRNSIESIKLIGQEECQCIKIEHSSELYITDDYIVTHNTSYGFALDFGITEQEAQVMIDKYFEGMPQMHEAIKAAHQEVKDKGFVTSMAGRRRHFDKVTDPNTGDSWYPKSALRQSFNFLIQGFSADMLRKAMVMIQSEPKPEWDLKAIMTVHDECNYQVREQYAKEAAEYIKTKMETAVNFCVPTPVDIDITNNYGEAK